MSDQKREVRTKPKEEVVGAPFPAAVPLVGRANGGDERGRFRQGAESGLDGVFIRDKRERRPAGELSAKQQSCANH